jgi:hypothetical protein
MLLTGLLVPICHQELLRSKHGLRLQPAAYIYLGAFDVGPCLGTRRKPWLQAGGGELKLNVRPVGWRGLMRQDAEEPDF